MSPPDVVKGCKTYYKSFRFPPRMVLPKHPPPPPSFIRTSRTSGTFRYTYLTLAFWREDGSKHIVPYVVKVDMQGVGLCVPPRAACPTCHCTALHIHCSAVCATSIITMYYDVAADFTRLDYLLSTANSVVSLGSYQCAMSIVLPSLSLPPEPGSRCCSYSSAAAAAAGCYWRRDAGIISNSISPLRRLYRIRLDQY